MHRLMGRYPCGQADFMFVPNVHKEEVQFTFDVTKCDKLFDVLLRGGVIHLAEGHVMPSAEVLA
jgi:hypothetical protein